MIKKERKLRTNREVKGVIRRTKEAEGPPSASEDDRENPGDPKESVENVCDSFRTNGPEWFELNTFQALFSFRFSIRAGEGELPQAVKEIF